MDKNLNHATDPLMTDSPQNSSAMIKRTLLSMMTLLILLFIAAVSALMLLAANLNQQADSESGLLLKKALQNRTESLAAHVSDYAWWGEAYENLHVNLNTHWAYVRQNVGPELYQKFGYDGVFVIDATDRTRYSMVQGKLSTQSLTHWIDAAGMQALKKTLDAPGENVLTSILTSVNGNPALVGAARITPGGDQSITVQSGPSSVLVFVDILGPEKLLSLGQEYGIQQVQAPATVTRSSASIEVPAQNGTLTLTWKSQEPGHKLLLYILPLLAAIALFTGVLAFLLVRSTLKKAQLNDEKNFLLEQNRQALAASERRFRDVAEATTDWIWETDAALNFTWLSERFPGITGHRIAAWLGKPLTALITADNQPLDTWITEPGQTGHRRLLHCRYLSAQGYQRYCHIAILPVITDDRVSGYRGTATDVTLEVEARARVQYLSRHDELTGLPNRVRMREFLEGKLGALPDKTSPLTMITLDLDKFKPVNDLFGHVTGDAVLHEVSARLRGCLRECDLVARQGGDEFIVIMPDMQRKEEVASACEQILSELRRPFYINGHEIFIGGSIGVALAPQDAKEAGELLRLSDIALYAAKKAGRNGWTFYAPEMEQQIVQRRELEDSLRGAIKNQQFRLVYQPRYDTASSKVVAVEALIRWDHPELGLIMPDQFILLAEETGLIFPISDWVLNTACRDVMQLPGSLAVSVNISAVEFDSEQLITRVKSALENSGLEPERLQIEITESATLRHPETSLTLMKALKALGVRLLMDDFGTGYSSISYLSSFPFDGIKLDKSFIDVMPASDNASAIVKNIIGLGKAYSMSITAEGVETREQLEKLKLLDCDEMQGYLIGRPTGLAELAQKLTEDSPATPWDV